MLSTSQSLASQAWYALNVKPRRERVAEISLGNKGLEVLHPVYSSRRRWSDRIKVVPVTLFPGYVFCKFGYEQRMTVLSTPCVTSVVSIGGKASPVAEDEIASIRSVVASGRKAMPWPYVGVGRQVRVDAGCLEGLVGTVVREKGLYRVVVNVDLLQRSVAVEIDREDLLPAEFAAAS